MEIYALRGLGRVRCLFVIRHKKRIAETLWMSLGHANLSAKYTQSDLPPRNGINDCATANRALHFSHAGDTPASVEGRGQEELRGKVVHVCVWCALCPCAVAAVRIR